MSAMHMMAQALTRTAAAPLHQAPPVERAPTGPTARIRALLADGQRWSGRDIATELEIEAGAERVYALMKHDLKIGRVLRVGNCYQLNRQYDNALAEQIKQAAALLRNNGYYVTQRGAR